MHHCEWSFSRFGLRASARLSKPSFFDTWLARSQATGEWKVLIEKIESLAKETMLSSIATSRILGIEFAAGQNKHVFV